MPWIHSSKCRNSMKRACKVWNDLNFDNCTYTRMTYKRNQLAVYKWNDKKQWRIVQISSTSLSEPKQSKYEVSSLSPSTLQATKHGIERKQGFQQANHLLHFEITAKIESYITLFVHRTISIYTKPNKTERDFQFIIGKAESASKTELRL